MLGDTASGTHKELRIHFGPGIGCTTSGVVAIIVLLCGGDKSSQARDISVAKRLAREWRKNHG
jgi:putative addiction module killer protein